MKGIRKVAKVYWLPVSGKKEKEGEESGALLSPIFFPLSFRLTERLEQLHAAKYDNNSKRTDGKLLLLEISKNRNCSSVGCLKLCAIPQLVSAPLNPIPIVAVTTYRKCIKQYAPVFDLFVPDLAGLWPPSLNSPCKIHVLVTQTGNNYPRNR